MPLTKKGAKILGHMRQEYGSEKKAKQVFYASANKGRIEGVHHDADFAAETGEPQGTPVNVSKGITPALLNERAQAMHAPEHDAEPGTRAAMAARRAGQLKAHVRRSENAVHEHNVAPHRGKEKSAYMQAASASVAKSALSRKAAIAPAKARASQHARKFGASKE
jgi:hypothetical protein